MVTPLNPTHAVNNGFGFKRRIMFAQLLFSHNFADQKCFKYLARHRPLLCTVLVIYELVVGRVVLYVVQYIDSLLLFHFIVCS